MKTTRNDKLLLFFALASMSPAYLSAQEPDAKKKTIDITSSFKPVLREAAKINFTPSVPPADTSKPRLNYSIPQQLVVTGYLPASLRPVAMAIDSVNAWKNSNYIKAGLGNVHIPYLQAGFSFGNGQNSYFNAFAEQYTSKGQQEFQKNNHAAVALAGTVRTESSLEWSGGLGFKSDDYFFYGFQPSTLSFTKDDLRQRFQDFNGKISLRNLKPTEFGLVYNPNLKVDVFSGNNFIGKGTETNTVLNLPLTKTFAEPFSFTLSFTGDLTHYQQPTGRSIQNNLYMVAPWVTYKNERFHLTAGITPSWEKKNFHLLPNIMAEAVTNNRNFTLQAGWIGHYDKGSYQRFAGINPWIAQPDTLMNTRVQEFYGGIRGLLLDHITYSAKVSAVEYHNLPLFVNDDVDGKTFLTVYSPDVQAVKVHGELGWTQGEDLSWNNTITLTNYTKVEGQGAAWGLPPVEFTSTLRWQLFKDFMLRGDLYTYRGAPYRAKAGGGYDDHSGQSGFDLSGGVEYKITRQLNLWLQLNNIFNDKYQRWNQYAVYGFNVLGGIVFSFDQK